MTESTAKEAERVWREADCLWTEPQIERAIESTAQLIEQDLQESNPLVLVVMKGGLIFGARLLMRLRFPLEIDYIYATRPYYEKLRSSLIELQQNGFIKRLYDNFKNESLNHENVVLIR